MSVTPLMRQQVKDAYFGSLRWADKVDKMKDAQILALHTKFVQEGKIK